MGGTLCPLADERPTPRPEQPGGALGRILTGGGWQRLPEMSHAAAGNKSPQTAKTELPDIEPAHARKTSRARRRAADE